MSTSITLLDEVGHLARTPSDAQIASWQQQLHSSHLPSLDVARLHLLLGEVTLARDEQPEQAKWHFIQTIQSAPQNATITKAVKQRKNSDTKMLTLISLAKRDVGFSLYYLGRYKESAAALRTLLKSPTTIGFDRRDTALFLRHVQACMGYHAERAKAGITEPTRLDPLCGIEAIAACLRGLHRPYDKRTVIPACRVTGQGSNMQDLINASKELNLASFVLKADDEGLKNLPMALVAFCEHDHFIAVIHADAKGVTYLCSDCGAWPGGERHVSWKQWHLMEAGPYLALCLPGSVEEEGLRLAYGGKSTLSGPQLAGFGGQSLGQAARLAERLKGHAFLYLGPAVQVQCGGKFEGIHCCPQPCPTDRGGCDGGTGGSGPHAARVNDAAPSAGDPVNLATGEEEYTPPTDLTVYNPIGPSVSLSRLYNSMRGPASTYQSDDFGVGWSHNYNYILYDPTVNVNYRVQQGQSVVMTSSGADSPNSGLTWDIIRGGSTVATSSSSNGWSVTRQTTSLTVTAPSSATIANGYEVRYVFASGQGANEEPRSRRYCPGGGGGGGGTGYSASFDVVASSTLMQVGQGGSATFINTGTDSPASGLTWDIVQSGTTIATSSSPNGWSIASPGTLTAPPFAAVGTYEARTHFSGLSVVSCNFQVYSVNYNPKAGTRYLIEPNGARVPITAASVPTSASPTVVCTVAAGYPLYVEWRYSSGSPSGYYAITGADRSTMITTTAAKAIGTTTNSNGTVWTATSALLCVLGQIVDRNGNAINFWYGASGSGGFPMLSAITDSNNSNLVTFSRDSTTGNVTAVNDRYSRSIYYSVGTYSNANVPSPWPQTYQEVDHVSQIVATGTGSPPDRYAYGYQDVNNGENTEQVVFLHTITVPSPTGTGNATATINYATDGTCVVTSIVDANGNSRNYSATDASDTLVTVKDSSNVTKYAYTANFDSNMSEVSHTNGSNVALSTNTYGDANDPYRPSSTVDANGRTSTMSWDQYGNCQSAISPRGMTATYTYDYSHFALGELTAGQLGSKTPTTLTYYEPSGLTHTTSSPRPGSTGSGQTVTTSYTYDQLGNVVTVTSPGDDATPSFTTTYNYTQDGQFTQSAAIGQALTITDNLGKQSHFRYDSQARMSNSTDALGIVFNYSHNIAGQTIQVQRPATGDTGPGSSQIVTTYYYPGGLPSQEATYDESGNVVGVAYLSYGPESEEMAYTGSTNQCIFSRDAAYRIVTSRDGNNNSTTMSFNQAGYPSNTELVNINETGCRKSCPNQGFQSLGFERL